MGEQKSLPISDAKTHLVPDTILQPIATMPPRIPLGPKNTNAYVQKKRKTSRIELSSHKRSVIEGLHKAGCSVNRISEI